MDNLKLEQLPPLSLYVHLPWCVKKCPYCDFNSHQIKTTIPERHYINALVADFDQAVPLIWGRSIQSIFIGGGTPSLFSGAAIDELLSQLRSRIRISPYAEITLEANPGTVERQFISEYKAAGVTRLSLGVQSFNDQHLTSLGRIHSGRDAQLALEIIAATFDNFNLDIIYGLPQQTIAQALADIQTAISFKPSHISAYNLTIEPNTEFAKFTPSGLPDNDLCYQMQDKLIELLAVNGYSRYEISAFARAGFECQHNLNYWLFGDYLGIGAGAHSKLSFHDKIVRQVRYKQPQHYLDQVAKALPVQTQAVIAQHDLPFEFMLNSLRLINGFATGLFQERTGLALNQILAKLFQAQEKQLLELLPTTIRPTRLGHDFLNELLILFLSDS